MLKQENSFNPNENRTRSKHYFEILNWDKAEEGFTNKN